MFDQSTRPKWLHLISRFDFTIFRWTAGCYLLILGISLIILPQGNLGVRLSPVWAYAFATFLAGLVTLWLIVIAPPRTWRILLSGLSILPLLASGWAYLHLGLLPPAVVFFLLAVGLMWSALVSPRITDTAYHPDAVGIIFGLIQAVQGVDLLMGNASGAVPAASGFTNVFFGLLFIGGGLAVVISQLVASTPDRLRKWIHGVSGFSLLGLLALQATYIDALYWILGAAVIIRGVVTILLPWYRDRMRRVDSTALRPRLALGLITAAVTPALLSIMIFLNLLDEQLVGRHFSRPILFGIVLLFAFGSGIAAWWFADKLTAPLTALVKAIPRIPRGQYELGIAQSAISEVANLESAIENMSQTISAQTVEREQLITRLQDQNQTLAMLEKSFRMVAENATEIITRFDKDLRHIYINPAIKRATGLEPEFFLGKTNRELGTPEAQLTEWDTKLQLVFSKGEPAVLDFTYDAADAQHFYQSHLVPETDEDGHVVSVLAIAHDITDLKLAQQHTERALQAMLNMAYASTASEQGTSAKKLLDSICEALGCEGALMMILVPNTQIIRDMVVSGFEPFVDPVFQQSGGKPIEERFDDPSIMTRLREGAVVELDVSRPPYAERQPRAGLKHAVLIPMRVTGVLEGIIKLYPKDGMLLNQEEDFAIASAAGNLAALLLAHERLFIEREEARVSALAAERTARYAEELQRVNGELTLFSHIVSHDLNEPLRMITSYLQLIERRYAAQLDQDAKDFIGFAVDGAARLKLLLNGLLSYTRVGSRAGKMEDVDLNDLIQITLRDLNMMIEETSAVVTHDALPTITAEPQQIGQLFQNLMTNAIKFRKPDGECRIHIGAQRQDAGWRFSVSDNGIGIDQQYWERIFLIFQRLQASPQIEGTGIGLAICKKIVERHGGSIWLESEVGKGSTFYFTIPDALR